MKKVATVRGKDKHCTLPLRTIATWKEQEGEEDSGNQKAM